MILALSQGVVQYSGKQPRGVEIVGDRKVPGTYALRVHYTDDTEATFLITGFHSGCTAEFVEQNLEEVEFTTWPPTSGELKFF